MLQRDRISNCSADGVKSGGITLAYRKDMILLLIENITILDSLWT